MKRIFFVIFLLGTLISKSEESKTIDSLINVISSTENDSLKIIALIEYDNLIYYKDAELDIKLNKQILDICVKNINRKLTGAKKSIFIMN